MTTLVPVGDLLTYTIGGGWGDEEASTDTRPCVVIRGTDLAGANLGSLSSAPRRFESVKRLESRALEVGDIILEVSGGSKGQATGRTALVTESLLAESEDVIIPASFCRLLRPDQNRVNPRYLYYWLQEMYSSGRVWSYQNQSTGIANFQMKVFTKSELVRLPLMSEQKRIVDILGALDDLIETNRRLSSDLLSLLFAKYEVLAGDRDTSAFGKVARLVRDQWKPGHEHPGTYLGLEHFATDGAGLIGSGEADSVNSTSLMFQPGDVLYGKLRPYFRKVARPGFTGICSPEIWVLRAQAGYPQSLVHALAHTASFSEAATAGSTGTRMPRADWKHISTVQVPALRTSDLDPDVLDGLETLWAVACDLDQESTELSRQRDELLPLLMSGEVRVRDLEAVA